MEKCLNTRIICFIYSRDLKELSELNRSRIAKYFEINECSLSRSFKKGTEMLLSDFLMRVKIFKAKEMIIRNDGKAIEEIAYELVF